MYCLNLRRKHAKVSQQTCLDKVLGSHQLICGHTSRKHSENTPWNRFRKLINGQIWVPEAYESMPPEDRKLPRQKIITDESHDTILTSYQPIYGHVSPTSMTKHALEGQTRVPEAYKSMHQEDQKSLNITPNMLPHYPTLTPRVHAYVTYIISNIQLHVRSN